MEYLTYSEYVNIGGILDVTAFYRNIVRACRIVDNATYSRVSEMTETPVEVKHCLRDLVEYLEAYKETENGITSYSQSAGGISESESYNTKNADDMSGDIESILYDYLLRVKDDNGAFLLYRG